METINVEKPVENKYFDNDWTTKIIRLSSSDPYQTVEEYKKYLDIYKNDSRARSHYVSALIKINEMEQAQKELKHLFFSCTDDFFRRYPEKFAKNYAEAVRCRFKLLCFEGRAREALMYYYTHKDIIANSNNENSDGANTKENTNNANIEENTGNATIDNVLCYLKILAGIIVNLDTPNDYLKQQMISYSENHLRLHVKYGQQFQGKGYGQIGSAYFDPDFPVDSVIDKVKELLSETQKMHLGYYDSSYIFRCEKCGIASGKEVDYFKVVTLNGTNHIIIMTPIDNFDDLPEYFDLTEFVRGGSIKKTGKNIA